MHWYLYRDRVQFLEETMEPNKGPFGVVVIATMMILTLACLPGCGSSSHVKAVTKYYAAADTFNSRVLIYNAPLSTDASASVALGQAALTDRGGNQGGEGAATMAQPQGVAVDSSGNLYVADWGNCRVTEYVPPFTTGMSASLVLGQSSFTSGSCVVSQTNLSDTGGLALDSKISGWLTADA